MTDQYPPIPKGFHRWEPRPAGWKPPAEVKYAFRSRCLPHPIWQEMPGLAVPLASTHCDYIEAVKDAPGNPPKPMPESYPEPPEPKNLTAKEIQLLALLHSARRHSTGMGLAAYAAIQDAINLLIE